MRRSFGRPRRGLFEVRDALGQFDFDIIDDDEHVRVAGHDCHNCGGV